MAGTASLWDLATSAFLFLAAGASYFNVLERVAPFFGLPPPLAPPLVALTGAIACALIVRAKRDLGFGEREYRYLPGVRLLAKVSVVVFLVLGATKLVAAMDELTWAPTTVGGFLIDSSGAPVEGASVRITGPDGADATTRVFPSDSVGYWIAQATRPTRRQDTILVTRPGCRPLSLPLRRSYEHGASEAGMPQFRHVVSCDPVPEGR
jgi:hypothetical protein